MEKSQNRSLSIQSFIDLSEGLSYSDYFSDEVPYDVKPVPCVTPMEEQDWPIQAHNLFKNAYNEHTPLTLQSIVKNIKNEQTDNSTCYWLDRNGNVLRVANHIWYARRLSGFDTGEKDNEAYQYMFDHGYAKLTKDGDDLYVMTTPYNRREYGQPLKLTREQKNKLGDMAINDKLNLKNVFGRPLEIN